MKGALCRHLEEVLRIHFDDLARGAGWVELPQAIARKYSNAGREWPWQFVFPASRQYTDRLTGQRRRHHLHETVLQRAVRTAVLKLPNPRAATRSGTPSRPTCSSLGTTSAPCKSCSDTRT